LQSHVTRVLYKLFLSTKSKIHELKALETVTYTTTRFSSSAFEQWEKIYKSHPALIQAYIKNREDQDDECEETKYQVQGQDYATDSNQLLL
jgi:Ran GTPase-activating protein (RanGAP) involved in mRNA processing and transport